MLGWNCESDLDEHTHDEKQNRGLTEGGTSSSMRQKGGAGEGSEGGEEMGVKDRDTHVQRCQGETSHLECELQMLITFKK